jgi:hypothetical protein
LAHGSGHSFGLCAGLHQPSYLGAKKLDLALQPVDRLAESLVRIPAAVPHRNNHNSQDNDQQISHRGNCWDYRGKRGGQFDDLGHFFECPDFLGLYLSGWVQCSIRGFSTNVLAGIGTDLGWISPRRDDKNLAEYAMAKAGLPSPPPRSMCFAIYCSESSSR